MSEREPVILQEDENAGDRFLVYSAVKGLQVAIRYAGDALWMTLSQIADLFGIDRFVVTKHVANVYAEGELDAGSNSPAWREFYMRTQAKIVYAVTSHTPAEVIVSRADARRQIWA